MFTAKVLVGRNREHIESDRILIQLNMASISQNTNVVYQSRLSVVLIVHVDFV